MTDVQRINQNQTIASYTEKYEPNEAVEYKGQEETGKSIFIQGKEYNIPNIKNTDSSLNETISIVDKLLTITNPAYVLCKGIAENRGISETLLDMFNAGITVANPAYGLFKFCDNFEIKLKESKES